MKLCDFIDKKSVVANLGHTDRDGVIRELVSAAANSGHAEDMEIDAVVKSILQREKQGSTGFGKGVAVPHVKHQSIKKMVGAVGRSEAGIDFKALDRAPVYSVFLLLSPPDSPETHLQAMETIFRHLQRDNFRSFLRQAETSEAITDLLEEADELAAR
jgi:mannitol/fructose-specific phosphotransferase system IIA component (Ntr-type)